MSFAMSTRAKIPEPTRKYPLPSGDRSLVFLNQVVSHPQVQIGDYTCYQDDFDSSGFLDNVRHLDERLGDRLIIGKFCLIGSGVSFLMSGASRHPKSIAAYPFWAFEDVWPTARRDDWPQRRDTVIASDAWIGYRATVLPGTTVGHGAIVGAHAVVSGDIPPYAIVVGNPGKIVKYRYSEEQIALLLRLAWWDWPIERITEAIRLVSADDVQGLSDFARRWQEPGKMDP